MWKRELEIDGVVAVVNNRVVANNAAVGDVIAAVDRVIDVVGTIYLGVLAVDVVGNVVDVGGVVAVIDGVVDEWDEGC